MRGVPVRAGIEVFPGPVYSFLEAVAWDEFHLFIYADKSRIFVILDGSRLIQAIDIGTQVTSGTINTTTGSLAVVAQQKLLLFEAITSYNKPPQWSLSYEHEVDNIRSVAWLDQSKLVVGLDPSSLAVHSWENNRLTFDFELKSPTGGSEVAASQHSVLQFGNGIPKLWHLANDRFDYVPHPSLIQWSQWVEDSLVTYAQDRVLRVWRTEPITNIWYSVQCTPEETPLVSQDRDALLIVILSPSRTRYHRLSKSSGLSVSEGDTLPVDVNGNTTLHFSLPYLYSRNHMRVDVYKCVNWDPTPLCSVTGSNSTKLCIDGPDTFWSLGSDIVRWSCGEDGLSQEVTLDNQVEDIAVFDKSLVASADRNTIFFGEKTWPAQDLLLLVGLSKTEALAVFPSKIVFLPSNITVQHEVTAAAWDGELCLVGNKKLTRFEVDIEYHRLISTSTLDLDHVPSKIVTTKDAVAYTCEDGLFVVAATTTQLTKETIHHLAFSHSGQFLAACTDDGLRVFSQARSDLTTTWICVREFQVEALRDCVWVNETLIALSTTGALYLQSSNLDGDSSAHEVALHHGVSLPKEATLQTLSEALIGKMCVYDPVVILHLAVASRISAVAAIFSRLIHELRFAEVSDGIAQLDRMLGLTPSQILDMSESAQFDINELRNRATTTRLAYLTQESQDKLLAFASVFTEFNGEGLDHSAMAFVYSKAFYGASSAKAFLWAYFSNSKGALLEKLPRRSWPSFYDEGYAFWLDEDQLSQELEENARLQFAKDRSPPEVSLYYLALNKKSVLQGLWRVSAGNPEREKTMKLLGHDFNDARWKTAAQKNAYALMSKHRDEYAAALFLLGNALGDCVQLLARKLDNLAMAVAIARVHDGDRSKVIQTISDRFLDQNDDWILCWAQSLQNNKTEARKLLSRREDPLKFWLLNEHLGGVSSDDIAATKNLYSEAQCELLAQAVDQVIPKETSRTFDIKDVDIKDDVKEEPGQEPTETVESTKGEKEWEVPSHLKLKPAPTNIQLEPDMSAFGF